METFYFMAELVKTIHPVFYGPNTIPDTQELVSTHSFVYRELLLAVQCFSLPSTLLCSFLTFSFVIPGAEHGVLQLIR